MPMTGIYRPLSFLPAFGKTLWRYWINPGRVFLNPAGVLSLGMITPVLPDSDAA